VDRDLVSSAQRGDRSAFVDLMNPRVDGLFALAQRILRDVDRAEDALQDALVIAWRDLRGLRDPDRFDAWLRRVVVRECIDQATRERRRVANLRVLPIDGPAAPDDLLTLADRDQLERGFQRLSPSNGRSSCSITSRATPRARSPRSSVSRRERPARVFITPTGRCVPRSTRTHGWQRPEGSRHDPGS
jgi:hypothetical protein